MPMPAILAPSLPQNTEIPIRDWNRSLYFHKFTTTRRKIPKSLSGIETKSYPLSGVNPWGLAAKYLNPYQGLKLTQSEGHDSHNAQAAKYLNPYQGLKPFVGYCKVCKGCAWAAKYLNPYQGLKHQGDRIPPTNQASRKIPKSLSGIETLVIAASACSLLAAKYLNPYQGLKPLTPTWYPRVSNSRKIPKSLSGIETQCLLSLVSNGMGRKIPKSLSGIETNCWEATSTRCSPQNT